MSERNPTDFMFLVLHVTRGAHFECFKNLHLQVSPSLQGKSMASNFTHGISQPNFDETFTWRLTFQHLKKLQTTKCEITIEIIVEESRKRWTAGSGTVGVQHALYQTANSLPYPRTIPIDVTKSPLGTGSRPELSATLTIHSTPPATKRCHIAYLSESAEGQHADTSGKSILKRDTTQPSTSTSAPGEKEHGAGSSKTSKSVSFKNID